LTQNNPTPFVQNTIFIELGLYCSDYCRCTVSATVTPVVTCINEVLRIFRDLSSNNLKCEFKTFNILINALLQGGRKDEANNLFSSVSGNGIVPDGVTYSLVIESHIESLLEEVMICFYHGQS
jgi:pentatricopeptide repeat protein